MLIEDDQANHGNGEKDIQVSKMIVFQRLRDLGIISGR